MSQSHLSSRDILKRAYALTSSSEARSLYDEWAASYDRDLAEDNYAFPERAVAALSDAIGTKHEMGQLRFLDAGCGTGLVGIELSKCGAKNIDGLDLSSGMLNIARSSGVYKMLEEADLTKAIARSDQEYDAVSCVGTLTKGHVGPSPVLSELARITKKNGFIVATILEEVWESAGFKAKIDELVGFGEVAIVRSETVGVRRDAKDGGRILVLEKLK